MWLPKKLMEGFIKSGTKHTPYAAISEAQFEAGAEGAGCTRVEPVKPVYATTTLTFTKPGMAKWQYENICPVAAAEMAECYRCPQADGTCVEYFKFDSEADYKAYKTAKWLPKKLMDGFIKSGTKHTPYAAISEAQFEAGAE